MEPIEHTVNFDDLTERTMVPDVPMEYLNDLFGSALALPKWHFISRGEFPNVYPYVASHPDYAEGRPMVRAFTDLGRLERFVKQNHLEDANGEHMVLSIPTENIIPYLEGFIQNGVHGIWFNSDIGSNGFFLPLQQLRPVKEHLERIGWKPLTE